VPASSAKLLEDDKLKEIMISDIGAEVLLARLKQSILSCKEFANFVKKRASAEADHYQSLKKLSRQSRESIKKPECRQGTFLAQFDKVVNINDKLFDVGQSFVTKLIIMNDELVELANSTAKSRKTIKESHTRHEKLLIDAEQLAEKAKHKYDGLCEDLEKVKIGDPTKNKFGFKTTKSTPQHEEELQRKVTSADGDYKQKVLTAQRLRSELINMRRPETSKELQELTLACDAAMSFQLQRYASLHEILALNNGFVISPLKPTLPSGSTVSSNPSLKEIAAKIDNEKDFFDGVIGPGRSKRLNRPSIQYRQHPSLTKSYPSASSSFSYINGSRTTQPTTSTMTSSSSPPQSIMSASTAGARFPPGTSVSTATAATNINNNNINNSSIGPGHLLSSIPVFGTPLEEILDAEAATVPRIVFQCTQAIDNFGLEVEGIYRTSGNSKQIDEIKALFDSDSSSVDLLNPSNNLNDIHAVAAALKLYFRSLPDPLFTHELYNEFLEGAKLTDDIARRDAIHGAINQLPDANYTTLRYLIFHLHRVQEREAVNRMSAGNLGIIWGPTLLGADNENVEHMAAMGKVVETVIASAYVIFDAD
ncbi:RhoGAP-domain-containing protein, partial [Nadsonia fulvescens var. elongata DSM 6958]